MTPFDSLREEVWQANRRLVDSGLVILTWGNASGIDRETGVVAIKPSGVEYDTLRPEQIVLVSLETGLPLDGEQGRPSSDTPTHLEIYRTFDAVGGIVHTHSAYATSYAQARREIPCYGTTHADQFHGAVPVTRALTRDEVQHDYERNTGRVIAQHFRENGLDPMRVPGALVAHHGPFTWEATPAKALECAVVLEAVAEMAFRSLLLNPSLDAIAPFLLDKHFLRKHGPGAYYGQKG